MKTFNCNGFETAILNFNQEAFLKSYYPKDMFFTSEEEMNQINEEMGLKDLANVEEARALRCAVVFFYRNHREELEDYMTSLQSVTAVIDHYCHTF